MTKWREFYGAMHPLATIAAIFAAVAYWNESYYVATFLASVTWTSLLASAAERDIERLRDEIDNEIDKKLDRLWDRIGDITQRREAH